MCNIIEQPRHTIYFSQEDLLQETGAALFCTTVNRLLEHKSVLVSACSAFYARPRYTKPPCSQDVVNKVFRGQVTKRYKKNAAMAFVKTRLGELRAEERRRVSFLAVYLCK